MKHEDLIRQMSLEEKCYFLSGKDFWQTRSVERLGGPNMTLSDGPHGIRKQAGEGDHLGLNPSLPATCFPTAATIANSWDPTLGEEIGKYLGIEAASQGVGVVLGGMCTMEMAEGILTICNGHFFKGLGAVVGGFFRSGKKRKAAAAIK